MNLKFCAHFIYFKSPIFYSHFKRSLVFSCIHMIGSVHCSKSGYCCSKIDNSHIKNLESLYFFLLLRRNGIIASSGYENILHILFRFLPPN